MPRKPGLSTRKKNFQRIHANERRAKLECVVSLPYVDPLSELKQQIQSYEELPFGNNNVC